MKAITVLRRMLGAGMGILVILGCAFWAGYLIQLVTLHRAIGVAYVLILWAISVIGIVRKRAVGLGMIGIVWGVVIAGLGFSQQHILVGDYHWVVRVLHLAVGWAAMPIAGLIERAFATSLATPPTPAVAQP